MRNKANQRYQHRPITLSHGKKFKKSEPIKLHEQTIRYVKEQGKNGWSFWDTGYQIWLVLIPVTTTSFTCSFPTGCVPQLARVVKRRTIGYSSRLYRRVELGSGASLWSKWMSMASNVGTNY